MLSNIIPLFPLREKRGKHCCETNTKKVNTKIMSADVATLGILSHDEFDEGEISSIVPDACRRHKRFHARWMSRRCKKIHQNWFTFHASLWSSRNMGQNVAAKEFRKWNTPPFQHVAVNRNFIFVFFRSLQFHFSEMINSGWCLHLVSFLISFLCCASMQEQTENVCVPVEWLLMTVSLFYYIARTRFVSFSSFNSTIFISRLYYPRYKYMRAKPRFYCDCGSLKWEEIK